MPELPTVPVLRSKRAPSANFSRNRRKVVPASTIPIARLLPPLKRYKSKKRVDKVVEGLPGQKSKERGTSSENTMRRHRSRERFDLMNKVASSEKLNNKVSTSTEECSSLDQPTRENLISLVQHSQVFDEVATRRELHFLIRSLIRSLSTFILRKHYQRPHRVSVNIYSKETLSKAS